MTQQGATGTQPERSHATGMQHIGRRTAARQVLVVVFDGFELLDATGPAQVFSTSNEALPAEPPGCYAVRMVSLHGGPVCSSTGIQICTEALPEPPLARHTTLVVVGGSGVEAAAGNASLVDWLHHACESAERVCLMGAGSLLLCYRDLLDGREVVTHWGHLERFTELVPRVRLHGNTLYTRSGKFHSSAGDTAGIDLCLSLVGDDHGRAGALAVARRLVVHAVRPGAQAQLRQEPAPRRAGGQFEALVEMIRGNLAKDWSVDEMACMVSMTSRSFHRHFTTAMAVTPSQFVAALRLEAASAMIDQGHASLKAVARRAGYGSEANMRNAFRKLLGLTPTEYVERARSTPAHAGN